MNFHIENLKAEGLYYKCKEPFHNEYVDSICAVPYCQKNRLNCPICYIDTHREHIDSMIKIKDIL